MYGMNIGKKLTFYRHGTGTGMYYIRICSAMFVLLPLTPTHTIHSTVHVRTYVRMFVVGVVGMGCDVCAALPTPAAAG